MPQGADRPTRPLLPFLALYGVLFASFGVASPFVPALMRSRGLDPDGIGAALAAGTAIRLLTGPLGGRVADRTGRRRATLVGFAAAAAAIGLLYGPAHGFAAVLAVSVLHASVLAPLTPLADALTLAAGPAQVRYGTVRAFGSAAFVLGVTVSGYAVGRFGLDIIIALNAGLLALAATAATLLTDRHPPAARPPPARLPLPRGGGIAEVLRLPWFPPLMLVASLVIGSGAMHDSFAVIRWRAAGVSPGLAGMLFSEQVVSEVLVFALAGPWLLARLGVRRACLLAAGAGAVRWTVTGATASPSILAWSEPLHGLTFALLHLACMRRIADGVPDRLLATAQTLYTTVATGAATALLTLLSGVLYGRFGGHAFWFMAALCLAAIPFAHRLHEAPAGSVSLGTAST